MPLQCVDAAALCQARGYFEVLRRRKGGEIETLLSIRVAAECNEAHKLPVWPPLLAALSKTVVDLSMTLTATTDSAIQVPVILWFRSRATRWCPGLPCSGPPA